MRDFTDKEIISCFTTVKIGKKPDIAMVWLTQKDIIQTVRNVLTFLEKRSNQCVKLPIK